MPAKGTAEIGRESETAAAGRPAGRSDRAGARRAGIRTEAARIFAERGYHGASMQEVADAVGCTKAGLYHYYGSKEELLFDILGFADEEIGALFAAEAGAETAGAAALAADPLAHVGRIVETHVGWYLRHPDIARVAFRDWAALGGERRAAQIERRRRHGHMLRDGIEACRRQGLIAADAPVGLLANFINGAVAVSNIWFQPAGPESPESIGAAFGDMAVAVLLGAAGSKGQQA